MSLTSQISSTEVSFKLSQKIVSALAEKFSFKFEDGWTAISNRPIDLIQKRLRREKRRANPASAVKHARTAFSFFTQKQRPVSQTAHPEASFGQLSRYVSEAWKALTPEQMVEFKTLEIADKERYQKERAAVLAALPVEGEAVAITTTETVAEPVKEKKVRKAKSAEVAKPVAEPVAATPAPAKKAKTPKAEVKAEVKAETKTEVKAETKTKVKTEPKAKTEVKADDKTEVKAAKTPKAKAVKA